jgi:tetratricopeptide (TPR) repeat protein
MIRRRSGIAYAVAVLGAVLVALASTSCAGDQSRRQAAGWTELGNAWAELGRWDKAGDAWSRAMALDPGQGVASYNLSRALAEAGKYDESIAKSDEYLESDPANAAVLSVKAYALYKSGRDEEALALYERVVALNGADSASVYNLAVLLESVGRTDEAMARYDAILALKPEDAIASFRKGLLLAAGGDAEGAVPLLERYLAANAESLEGHRALALAQERTGRYMEALESYAAIVAKAPEEADSWFALARLRLTVAEDGPGGLDALKTALQKGFKDRAMATDLLAEPGLMALDEVQKAFDEAAFFEDVPESVEETVAAGTVPAEPAPATETTAVK